VQLVFDHQVFSFQQHGGVSRYFCEVAERLAGYDGCDVTVLAPMYVNAYLAKLPSSMVVGQHVPPIPYSARLRLLLNGVLARGWLATARPDVVHETYFARLPVAPRRAACVVTVFDMIHERFPEYFSPNDSTAARKAAVVRRADRVICISESTRRDLLERVSVDPEVVSVVHLAGAPVPAARPTRPVVDGPYVLYLGARRGYKNFEGLLRAIAGSPVLRAGLRVVAFGGGPLGASERTLVRELGLDEGAVVQLSGDDATLDAAYTFAAAFVYPSRYEGFGIPPLEAMARGCPVVCAANSSLPEVVGDAAELCDADDPESIAAAIERVVASPAHADELRARGRVRSAQFTWDRCARASYEVYRAAAAMMRRR
jgi:glycosyltransferase involved in cell wall biosynthesis